MTDTRDVVAAADIAFGLVEAVDEAWLYRHASQSVLDATNTSEQAVLCQPEGPSELVVYDRSDPEAWIQSQEYRAVRR